MFISLMFLTGKRYRFIIIPYAFSRFNKLEREYMREVFFVILLLGRSKPKDAITLQWTPQAAASSIYWLRVFLACFLAAAVAFILTASTA